jgi:hypothetical protein
VARDPAAGAAFDLKRAGAAKAGSTRDGKRFTPLANIGNPAAVALSKLGPRNGGKARAAERKTGSRGKSTSWWH